MQMIVELLGDELIDEGYEGKESQVAAPKKLMPQKQPPQKNTFFIEPETAKWFSGTRLDQRIQRPQNKGTSSRPVSRSGPRARSPPGRGLSPHAPDDSQPLVIAPPREPSRPSSPGSPSSRPRPVLPALMTNDIPLPSGLGQADGQGGEIKGSLIYHTHTHTNKYIHL